MSPDFGDIPLIFFFQMISLPFLVTLSSTIMELGKND